MSTLDYLTHLPLHFCVILWKVIQKEKLKTENERSQLVALKRESQSLSVSCEDVEQKRQKLSADLHTKESHIGTLNGQIAHLKKLHEQENTKVVISQWASLLVLVYVSRPTSIYVRPSTISSNNISWHRLANYDYTWCGA